MMYGFWGMECNGQNFLLFFALFPLLITQKLKFWKTEKETSRYYHFTHAYHKWKSYDVWFLRYEAWLTESFVIVDHFLPFYPPTNPKIKILKNWRKGLQILSFYTCTMYDNHRMYGYWDIKHDKQDFLSFWTIFCPPCPPLTTQKIKILKKWKTSLEILSFYICVP